MVDITLPHNFTPRDYQLDYFAAKTAGCKRCVLVWNRRAGKDTCAWNALIYTAWEKRGIYYYVFPTFAQGRKVLWDGMTNEGLRFLDFIPNPLIKALNGQEMKITLRNGSIIQVVGSDKYDALMGTNPSGCIFSEYSLQHPNAWNYIRPILDANGGWADFVFTPRGSNHAKELYDIGCKPENASSWFVQRLTNDDSHILTKEEIDKLRIEEMSEDMIQQEWYCSFTLGIQGSYYAKYLSEARDNNRITFVPHDKHGRVYTAFDLGLDCTAIVFFQYVGQEVHVIDYYENKDEEISHYVKVLREKPYIYDQHFAPSDSAKRSMGDKKSTRNLYGELGVDFTVLPTIDISLDDGIEYTRALFPRVWIDEKKCLQLIRALENYRREWDDEHKIYKSKPVHDRWSHGSDAFRYMAIASRIRRRDTMGVSDQQDEDYKDRYQPIFPKGI